MLSTPYSMVTYCNDASAIHWPITGHPLAIHWSITGHPLAIQWINTGHPFISYPLTNYRSSISYPRTMHGSSIRYPLAMQPVSIPLSYRANRKERAERPGPTQMHTQSIILQIHHICLYNIKINTTSSTYQHNIALIHSRQVVNKII